MFKRIFNTIITLIPDKFCNFLIRLEDVSRRDLFTGELINPADSDLVEIHFFSGHTLSDADGYDAFTNQESCYTEHLSEYNPASGLPMIGAVDVASNLYGCCDHMD
jgi:hypothetical protein